MYTFRQVKDESFSVSFNIQVVAKSENIS